MTQYPTARFDVLCVGHASWDLILEMDHHPAADEKATAEKRQEMGGGPAANAAVQVARMGGQAAFAGYLGRDIQGERHLAELSEEGIDTSAVWRGDVLTAFSVILVKPGGARTVINHRETPPASDLGETGIRDLVAQSRVVLFDGHELELSEQCLKANRQLPQPRPTVLDAGSLRESTRTLSQKVDWVVAGEKFARQYTGESNPTQAARRIADGRRHAIITLGEHGLVWCEAQGVEGSLKAFAIEAVDTTGAGDAFHGAFALGLAQGLALEENLRRSSAAGALCCRQVGGRRGSSYLYEIQAFLAKQFLV